jgi:glycosyltransferase involved in cell wall biosynthesis
MTVLKRSEIQEAGVAVFPRTMRRLASWCRFIRPEKFTLEAVHQLAHLDGDRWKSTGDSPEFLIRAPHCYPGYYRFRMRLDLDGETTSRLRLMAPQILIDAGDGFTKYESYNFLRPENGRLYVSIFIPPDIQSGTLAIRFCPASSACEFSLSRFEVIPDVWATLTQKLILYLARVKKLLVKGMRVVLAPVSRAAYSMARWLYRKFPICRPLLNRLKILKSRFFGIDRNYQKWIKNYDRLVTEDRVAIWNHIEKFHRHPLISIVIPVYNTPERWLRRCLESVFAQLYPYWELCIADDGSTAPHVRRILEEYRIKDNRVKIVYRSQNGHICAASNDALSLAEGEFIALLDHDDELAEHALYMMALEILQNPHARLLYSDEDKIDERGRRFNPYFKSDFSYDLFLSQNMINHLAVFRTELVSQVGRLRIGLEGSQDWDLALRCIERLNPGEIRHIPHVLYHWRAVPSSTALGAGEKSYAVQAGQRAVSEHLARSRIKAAVEPAPDLPNYNRVRLALSRNPKVSLIIPTRNGKDILSRCIDSIKETRYAPYEILIVDNGSDDPETLKYLDELSQSGKAKILRYPKPFNYPAINNFAVSQAEGEIIVLLNNDTEVISPDWLYELVSHACRPEVGAVGALLLYPDGSIQHGGIILVGGVAGHAFKALPRHSGGYFSQALLCRDVSAVTAACLAVRKSLYQEVGGLDADNLPVAFNDVDFCLRLREKGYLNVYTPYAELYHFESKTRGDDLSGEKRDRFKREVAYMKRRWGALLSNDPYYNPNLTLDKEDFRLAWPPRSEKPWRGKRV